MANWSKIGSRGNVQDRRGRGPVIGGGLGVGGIILALVFTYLNNGSITTGDVLNQLQNTQIQTSQLDASAFEGEDSYEVFTSTVLGSANDMWRDIFSKNDLTYEPPRLVLFRGSTDSGCGGADSRFGPHYCPEDETIYLDETFFDELQKLGGQGDVAEAYVIAHEVGHHAQHQLKLLSSGADGSISTELQADCFAGLWAYSIRDKGVFEPNEIKEALDAASAVGDDRVQSTYEGRVTPETWTHGSSAQRVEAFNKGFVSGSMDTCL
jgi:predicted metalloprotease